jgi:DNA processing protein
MNFVRMNYAQHLQYTLALSNVPHLGPIRFRKLIEKFGSAENAFHTPISKWELPIRFSFDETQKKEFLLKAEREMNDALQHKIDLVTFQCEQYPKRLKYFDDAPIFLFKRGNAEVNPSRTIGVVGTRNATAYGRTFCNELIASLRALDVAVISGLALGIDSQAHSSALENNLVTWACIANGHENIYPKENRKLLQRIEETGLVFSELAPHVKAEREFFQTRNRCIAALSDALLVVESAEKGGALVTANFANDFNKEVFALPGRANDVFSRGCNNLIRQQKAHLITSAEELCTLMDWKIDAKPTQLQMPELNIEETKIFNLLRREHSLELDVLKWKFEGENLALHLLKMELKGVVRCLPGNKVELT